MKKAILNWSGGKDCAFALFRIKSQFPECEIRLVTSFLNTTKRVSMHGIRQELIEKQADKLGLKLEKVFLPNNADNITYESLMTEKYKLLKSEGFLHSVFGDIFLEDIRQYRESFMDKLNMTAVFPLWKQNTEKLALQFIHHGFKAIIISANEKYFSESALGREYNTAFLDNLPKEVDHCGERGEFHTFVFDGPVFSQRLQFETGKTTRKVYPSQKGITDEIGLWFLELEEVKE
jgi:uncharacterized protein (TIGR00290 family)